MNGGMDLNYVPYYVMHIFSLQEKKHTHVQTCWSSVEDAFIYIKMCMRFNMHKHTKTWWKQTHKELNQSMHSPFIMQTVFLEISQQIHSHRHGVLPYETGSLWHIKAIRIQTLLPVWHLPWLPADSPCHPRNTDTERQTFSGYSQRNKR